jgi:hypothetical protein
MSALHEPNARGDALFFCAQSRSGTRARTGATCTTAPRERSRDVGYFGLCRGYGAYAQPGNRQATPTRTAGVTEPAG